jgi:hypothetical protein
MCDSTILDADAHPSELADEATSFNSRGEKQNAQRVGTGRASSYKYKKRMVQEG